MTNKKIARAPLTQDQRKLINEAIHSIARSADGIKAGCSIDGEWPDDGDKVFYDAEVALVDRLQSMLATVPSAPAIAPEAKKISAPDIILTGSQLLEALDLIAPDRATDPDQLESEVAFGYGEGHSGDAMYIWCAEYPEEGAFVCDGSSANAAPVAPTDEETEDAALSPESEREVFNSMMRWHLIRMLQAWRYSGNLREVGMSAFEWARTNNVGQEAFRANERAIKLAAPVQAEQQGENPPFGNCSFQICDLPGQCHGEGQCHHPKTEQRSPNPDPIIAAKDVLLAAIKAGGPKAHFAAGEVFGLADFARERGMGGKGSMLDALKADRQRDGGATLEDQAVYQAIADNYTKDLQPSARMALSDALNEYERQTKALPCQHEVPERGCCSYNWRMACVRDIRTILADNAAPLTDASQEVLTERRRQIEQEGWTPEYDDEHHNAGALASAATAYALAAAGKLDPLSQGDGQYDNCPPNMWPFAPKWWKPSTPRRDLVKAGALILAEIERTDRETATSNNEVSR